MIQKFIPVIPKVIDLEITNACPASCPMCPRDKLPEIGIMPEETFESLYNKIIDYKKIEFLVFCGIGEPLIHPKFFDYAEKLAKIIPYTKLVTTAEKLSPNNFEKLKKTGLKGIQISIQSIEKELYEKLMPGLKFEKVMENINYLKKNQGNLDISLSFTFHKENIHEKLKIIEFAKQSNLKLSMREVHTRGGNMIRDDLVRMYPESSVKERCRIFESINFIAWNGNIHTCCQDVSREHIVGNINKNSLNEIAITKTKVLHNKLSYNICLNCDDSLV